MKNLILYKRLMAICLIGTIGLLSCSKELESLKPKDAVFAEDLTSNDIIVLRNGLYSQMQGAVFSYWFDFDKRGENLAAGPGFSLIDPISMSPGSTDVAGIWRSIYTNLLSVNFFIESIDALGTEATPLQLSYKGEALFFRALLYYNLVTRWGGVPIITKRTYEPIQRSAEKEVFDQIIADLNEASKVTASYTSSWFVSTQAVNALFTKVFLAQKQYDNVITYANRVISSGKFSQATDTDSYAAIFSSGSPGKEIILALSNSTTSDLNLFYQSVNDRDATWDYSPDPFLYTKLYADSTTGKMVRKGDIRKSAVFSSNNTRLTKFPNGKSGQQHKSISSDNNPKYTPIVILRYSDIILALAEAQSLSASSSSADAAATLNSHFANRYKTPPSQASVRALSPKDFQNLILNERRREFYGEGQWWYDVKRTGRTDLFKTLAGRNRLLLYPIPQTEKDLAGYTQNPDY